MRFFLNFLKKKRQKTRRRFLFFWLPPISSAIVAIFFPQKNENPRSDFLLAPTEYRKCNETQNPPSNRRTRTPPKKIKKFEKPKFGELLVQTRSDAVRFLVRTNRRKWPSMIFDLGFYLFCGKKSKKKPIGGPICLKM